MGIITDHPSTRGHSTTVFKSSSSIVTQYKSGTMQLKNHQSILSGTRRINNGTTRNTIDIWIRIQ